MRYIALNSNTEFSKQQGISTLIKGVLGVTYKESKSNANKTIVFLFSLGFGVVLRINNMFMPVNYHYSHNVDGRSYYTASFIGGEENKYIESRVDIISDWLLKNNFQIKDVKHIYINEIKDDMFSAFICSREIDSSKSNCNILLSQEMVE